MDKKVSKYFCIFCENCCNFSAMSEAYNHYKQHMNVHYYCPDCDNNRKCSKTHGESESTGSGEEGLIEMWIERFLSYQNELMDKTYSELFRSCKLFSGCVVCETFLRLCLNNDIPQRKGDIQWSSNQSISNETRHVNSHLRYYPFECFKCEKVGKYHKKCDFSEISRHIKSSHSMALKETNFDSLVKLVKIRKLESFIEYQSANKNPNQTPSQSRVRAPAATPTRSSKRIINQVPKPVVIESEPKPKRTRIEAQVIVTNNMTENQININSNSLRDKRKPSIGREEKDLIPNTNQQNNRNESLNNVPKSDRKIIENINERHSKSSAVFKTKAKVEIKFKPIVKNYTNLMINNNMTSKPKQNNLISGDQIIIKKVPELVAHSSKGGISLIKKSTPTLTISHINPKTITPRLTLSQQFSDMMDDEDRPIDLPELDVTAVKMVPNDFIYFCVFCTEKLCTKDGAYQHLQKHLDYYPIICLTCSKGLSDLQSFMKHHRESHPEAVKGRYKKKEQPILDNWISSFLYSQTTIIRSFPARESCPVCDRVYSTHEVQKNKPRRCTINRRIDHLYRHLSYLPYECILCQQNGNQFFVAYFESKAHSHIKLKHPEIDDNESRWDVFQKTVTIPKLDEYIENYLSNFGISMQIERRPVKKSNKYCSSDMMSSSNSDSIQLNDSSLNLNMIFSDLMEPKISPQIQPKVSDDISIKSDSKPDMESLVVINDNIDLEALNQYNNNSNDSDIVVNVSPLTLIDRNISDDCEEELYFCIFCSEVKYFSKIEAYSHYGSHLEYLPVLCTICSNNFANVDHLMAHHKAVHSTQANVDYEICEDQVLVKWLDEFLESQQIAKKVMSCSCYYNCPVCVKMVAKEKCLEERMPCVQHNDVSFSVHIHKHLNYFPYECLTCKLNSKTVRVPNLDSMAMNHLKEHKIENASMSQVVKNFPKTLVIPKLERLIGDSVHRKRVSEKKIRLDYNPMMSLQQSFANNNNNNSLQVITIDSEPSTSSSTSSLNKTQHIRLEGGRVVNLPPKDSSRNGNHNNSDSEINGSSEKQMNSICCVNCRKYFPNKKLFKLHHIQSHPGKPILCSKNI